MTIRRFEPHVKLLQACKRHLSAKLYDNHTNYICHALDEALYKLKYVNLGSNFYLLRQEDYCEKLWTATNDIKLAINHRLIPYVTVTNWLEAHGYIATDDRNHPEMYVQIQRYRQRWVNQLIKEYKEKRE